MALSLLKHISESITIGLWKIEETVDYLIAQSYLDEKSKEIVKNFHLDKRKKEWLCVRILIKEIFGKNIELEYMENGKPFICNVPFSISISHSVDYVAVVVSKIGEVGIDIEFISPRIEKIKTKFLSQTEQKGIPTGESYLKHMLLYWCAKETLMKICGKKEIDFKRHLKINPFLFAEEGSMIGEIVDNNSLRQVELNYFEIDNNMVVWGCEKSKQR